MDKKQIETEIQNMTGTLEERSIKLMQNALALRRHNVTKGEPNMPVEVGLRWHTVEVIIRIVPREGW